MTHSLSPAHLRLGGTSFLDFARETAPELVARRSGELSEPVPHATTIVALTAPGAVVLAGDRRATAGSHIAHREMEKVLPADSRAAIGVAGVAGIGLELIRLFQLELEHYEKIEGVSLSLEGKANRLSHLVRANLPLASQGLAAVPLLGGYDPTTGQGRLYSYDAVGGRYAERDHHAIGSGAPFARGTLRNGWRADLAVGEAVQLALAAIIDAAEEDSGTGGVDAERGIYPVVAVVDAAGYRRVPDEELRAAVAELHRSRRLAQTAASPAAATPGQPLA